MEVKSGEGGDGLGKNKIEYNIIEQETEFITRNKEKEQSRID